MCEELSLLAAHCCMLPTLYSCEEEDPLDCRPVTQCKVISIAIHYFFTTCFTFMFLEGSQQSLITKTTFILHSYTQTFIHSYIHTYIHIISHYYFQPFTCTGWWRAWSRRTGCWPPSRTSWSAGGCQPSSSSSTCASSTRTTGAPTTAGCRWTRDSCKEKCC